MDARSFWQLYEPYHAITYFAPESSAAYEAVGLRGFWRGYFAGRAAPMGPVDAGVVVATFYGFRPDFVARAIPSVWELVSPQVALQARLDGIDAAVRRIFDVTEFSELAAFARRATEACGPHGRPLLAANAELDWPEQPHLVLWHACTLLREHRGDGHIAALVANELDPVEAHITQVAASGAPLDSITPYRGWDEGDWAAGAERLRARGLLDADGALTSTGRELRARVEDDTDRLASGPLAAIDGDRFASLMRPIAAHIFESGSVRFPNQIGRAHV